MDRFKGGRSLIETLFKLSKVDRNSEYVIYIEDNGFTDLQLSLPNGVRVDRVTYELLKRMRECGLKEIVIVDDASVDETEAYIKALASEHSLLRYARHPERRNLPASRNTGVAVATGDYIAFGEDDVIFRPDYLKQLMECMRKTGADIIAGRLIETYVGRDVQFAINRANQDTRPLTNKRHIFARFWINLPDDVESPLGVHSCSLIKKEVFEKVVYDEGYTGNANREETDFYVTAIKNGFKVFFCPHTGIQFTVLQNVPR